MPSVRETGNLIGQGRRCREEASSAIDPWEGNRCPSVWVEVADVRV